MPHVEVWSCRAVPNHADHSIEIGMVPISERQRSMRDAMDAVLMLSGPPKSKTDNLKCYNTCYMGIAARRFRLI